LIGAAETKSPAAHVCQIPVTIRIEGFISKYQAPGSTMNPIGTKLNPSLSINESQSAVPSFSTTRTHLEPAKQDTILLILVGLPGTG
jgi:hypothetical protein